MKFELNGIHYYVEPCKRGDWVVDDTYAEQGGGLVARFRGWDGETDLDLFYQSNQSGMQEFVVMETRVDDVLTWHRVSDCGFSSEASSRLKVKLEELLNVLMDDGIQPVFKIPAYLPVRQEVNKNRQKAVVRMTRTNASRGR